MIIRHLRKSDKNNLEKFWKYGFFSYLSRVMIEKHLKLKTMTNLEKVLANVKDYELIPLTDLGYEDEEGDRLIMTINTTDNIDNDFNTCDEIEKAMEENGWYMVYREFPEMGFER